LVAAIPAVQHGSEAPSRMNSHVDWKIAQLDLFARGPQRPQIREQYRAILLTPGQSAGLRSEGGAGRLAHGGSAAGYGKQSREAERQNRDSRASHWEAVRFDLVVVRG